MNDWGMVLRRVGAAVAGIATVAAALVSTVGGAIVVPILMVVISRIARRRGAQLTLTQEWIATVLTFGVVALVVVGVATASGALHGFAKTMHESFVRAQQQPPPPQPEFLRQLGAPPPTPMPPSIAAPLGMFALVWGFGMWCVMTGTLGWSGSALVRFAIRGPAVPAAIPVDETLAA